MIRAKLYLILVLIGIASITSAQEKAIERPSPTALTAIRYKDSYIKITYCQPKKRGRVIFGGVVPYGQVWRTGANEATEITATKDIFIKGVLLPAGTYSIFTIPEKENWTIIINKEVGLWGSYNYNEKLDVMRFVIPAQSTTQTHESFTIQFDQRNSVADLLLLWDQVKISIPIQFIEPKP